MAEEPPYLTVGTEVSAKYKGAFCEAKIKKVVRTVKCKVTFKSGLGSTLLSDDNIRGPLRLGSNVEARHPDKNLFIEATINKIQDCSQYTVVFDDGDITTLKRSALVLKSGRHFNESETLDQLPLTHPEHFSNPVVAGRRNVRKKSGDGDESSEEEDLRVRKGKKKAARGDVDIGKVVCVEVTDKKKSKDNWFPALIVTPSAQETVKIRTKDEYLVRSFRDGRYYTVPKKEITDFTKDVAAKVESGSNVLKTALDKAMQFLEKNELPPHWDKDVLFASVPVGFGAGAEAEEDDEISESAEESDEDILGEEKDRFVAQLYKFMDDRGTPINKVPIVCNKDLDLYKLYKIVSGKGGYNKVTNSSQWKPVTVKMGFGSMPTTSTINLVKQAYKKFIHNFEEFFRKLGCSLNPLSSSTKSRSNRSIFRDRHASSSSKEVKKEEAKVVPLKEVKADPDEKLKKAVAVEEPIAETAVMEQVEPAVLEAVDEPTRRSRSRLENRSKRENEESPEKSTMKPAEKVTPKSTEKNSPKSQEKSPSKSPEKLPAKPADKSADKPDKVSNKNRRIFSKEKSKDKETTVKSTEESEPPPPTHTLPTPSPSGPSTSVTKKGVGRGKYKRKSEKDPLPEPEIQTPIEEEVIPDHIGKDVAVLVGDKLQVYYGPKSDGKVTYDAKVIDVDDNKQVFLVHYTGWNTRYDEWIPRTRISENSSLRTDSEVCPPQGRGPGQPSVSDSAASSDAGSISKESTSTKGVRKKPRTAVLPPSTTRSKSGIATRKRLSSEGDAISTKRKTRKRAVLSGAESEDDSSDSEDAKAPVNLLIRSRTKSIENPDGLGSSVRSASEGALTENISEIGETEKQSQVIDLNQIRLEMKGLEKTSKVDSPPATSQPEPKMDIYDFEEDTSESPKLKTFTPRSPDKKDDLSMQQTDLSLEAISPPENFEPPPAFVEPISPRERIAPVISNVELKVEAKANDFEKPVPINSSAISEVVQPSVDPIPLPLPEPLASVVLVDESKLKRDLLPALPQLLVSEPRPVLHTQPPPLIPITAVPALMVKTQNTVVDASVSVTNISGSSPLLPLPTLTQRPTLPVLTPVVPSSAPPLVRPTPTTPAVAPKVTEQAAMKPDADSKVFLQAVTDREPYGSAFPLKVQALKPECSVSYSLPIPAVTKTPVTSKLASRLIPVGLDSGVKLLSIEKSLVKSSPSVIQPKQNPMPVVVPGRAADSSIAISAASAHSGPSGQIRPISTVVKRKKKVISKNIFDSSIGAAYGTPAIILPVKRPAEGAAKTPAKKPKKLVSIQSTKFQTTIPQVPTLLTHILPAVPACPQPLPLASSSPRLKLPFSQDPSLPLAGMSPLSVAPMRIPMKVVATSAKKIVQMKKPVTVVKKVTIGKITTPAHPTTNPTPAKLGATPLSKSLLNPSPKKTLQKVVKSPVKLTKIGLQAVGNPATYIQNTVLPKKMPSSVKEIPSTSVVLPPPVLRENSTTNPFDSPKMEERPQETPIQIKTTTTEVQGQGPLAFTEVSKHDKPPEKLKEVVSSSQEQSKDPVLETVHHVALLAEEESCHSLLCAEEIPGSPPPGTSDDRFGFEDETARHHSPTLPVSTTDDPKICESAKLPVSFASICTKSPEPPRRDEIKPAKEDQCSSLPKPALGSFSDEPRDTSAPSLPQTQVQSELDDEYLKDDHVNEEAELSQHLRTPSAYQSPDHAIDNSPPTTPDSSSSLSSGSPRGDRGRMSPIGDNSSKAQPSDTDSMDCLKPGDIADDNSNSSDTSRRFSNNPPSPDSKNVSSAHDDRRGDSPPGKRRRVIRHKSPDEAMRSYRGGRHSTMRRFPGGNSGSDPDSGRMPPPNPPINLGKPPKSEKFNFIPVLTDDMEPEERIALIQSSMMDLKLCYMATKAKYMLVERRKKRLKKREREREKEILKTLPQDVEDEKHENRGIR